MFTKPWRSIVVSYASPSPSSVPRGFIVRFLKGPWQTASSTWNVQLRDSHWKAKKQRTVDCTAVTIWVLDFFKDRKQKTGEEGADNSQDTQGCWLGDGTEDNKA